MGEGVRGIYRVGKQQTSGPKGVRLCTIHSGPKDASYIQVLSSG
jgi:hypothetical protein